MKNLVLACLMLFSTLVFSAPTEVRVLMYHRINDSLPPSEFNVHSTMLSAHLDAIRELGYTTVTISELTQFLEGKIKLPKKSVAITFDDGWRDNIVGAMFLIQRDMAATFYVMSGAFDNSANYLTRNEIAYLAHYNKFEIGAHSHTHFMEWEGKMDTVDDRIMIGEMILSKIILEDIIKKPVTAFAWPFGYSRQTVMSKTRAIGYTSTVHVNHESKNTIGVDPLHISRINVDGNCKPEHLKRMLETGNLVKCN